MFYGAVIAPGKSTAYVPPPEDWNLHLSQAALPVDAKDGSRVSLSAKMRDEEPVIIATLTAGRLDSVPLDLFFEEYVEFSVQVGGAAPGHGLPLVGSACTARLHFS